MKVLMSSMLLAALIAAWVLPLCLASQPSIHTVFTSDCSLHDYEQSTNVLRNYEGSAQQAFGPISRLLFCPNQHFGTMQHLLLGAPHVVSFFYSYTIYINLVYIYLTLGATKTTICSHYFLRSMFFPLVPLKNNCRFL